MIMSMDSRAIGEVQHRKRKSVRVTCRRTLVVEVPLSRPRFSHSHAQLRSFKQAKNESWRKILVAESFAAQVRRRWMTTRSNDSPPLREFAVVLGARDETPSSREALPPPGYSASPIGHFVSIYQGVKHEPSRSRFGMAHAFYCLSYGLSQSVHCLLHTLFVVINGRPGDKQIRPCLYHL